MRESRYSIEPQRVIFRETFNSEQDVRRRGGVPTDVTFSNGVGAFNGSSKIIYTGVNIDKNNFIASIKFKFNNLTRTRLLSVFTSNSNSVGMGLWIESSGALSIVYMGITMASTSYTFLVNTLYDVVFLRSATTISIYINGDFVFSNTRPDSAINFGKDIHIGFGYDGYERDFLDGDVDLVKIYNYALSAEEVKNLYEGKRFRALVSPTEILGISSNSGSIVDKRNNSLITNAITIVKEGELRNMSFNGSTSYIGTEMAGTTDLYLPSKDELKAMYDKLYLYGAGGFSAEKYWSSSEGSAGNAYALPFNTGIAVTSSKASTRRVRACRTFTAEAGVYSLRGIGPTGGLIFYIDGGTVYYETPSSDQSAGKVWSNVAETLIGTTDVIIGEGQNNTNEIIAQAGHTDSAAKLCDDLEFLNPSYIIGILAPTTAGSLAVWVRTDDATATQEIISFGDTDVDTRIQFDIIGAGLIRALIGISGVTQWALDTDNTVIKNNVWTHVALTTDGADPILYINGIAVAQTFSTSTDKTKWFSQMSGLDNGRIGCGNWNSGGNATFFDGLLNDIKIFTSALTAQQVSQIFSSNRGRYNV